MYLIYSSLTNALYINEKRQAAAFRNIADAEGYCKKNTGLYVYKDERPAKALYSDSYASGAVSVNLKEENGEVKNIRLQEDRLERRFYNGKTNADIARYIYTKDPACLHALCKDRFIVPIKITSRPYVKAVYLTVYDKSRGDERSFYYLAFTDLKEYEKWGRGKEEWAPLMVDFRSLERIGRNHGFIINLMGIRFLLNRKKFDLANEEVL